jgi:hypothetical protein
MKVVLLRQLVQRLFASNGFKRHLRLERQGMVLAGVLLFLLQSHRAILRPVSGRLRLSTCSNFRSHFSSSLALLLSILT